MFIQIFLPFFAIILAGFIGYMPDIVARVVKKLTKNCSKLTNAEKIERLKYLYRQVLPFTSSIYRIYYLCPLYKNKYDSILEFDIPELYKNRTVRDKAGWFNNNCERLDIIDKTIFQLQQKSKKWK